nr:NAC domain-containing protein 83-like [Ipomoea trifida]
MEIPLGLRFKPFDYDVLRFLFDFVTGRSSVDDEALIHEEDIFGEKEPWELIPSGKKMAYFLTRLKKKGSRVQRTVGKKMKGKKSGTWHGQDTGKAVADQDGKFVMGYKRSFVYKNESEPEQNGQWLMKEFYLPETIMRRARAQFRIVKEREDFVLCRIHPKKYPKKYDDDDDDDDENTLEEGGTNSNDSEAVPVETTTLQRNDDPINSYLVGVPMMETAIPVETLLDNMNSYIVGAPVETLLAAPAVDGVPVETLPGMDSFMNLLLNIEDVTTLIDFDA